MEQAPDTGIYEAPPAPPPVPFEPLPSSPFEPPPVAYEPAPAPEPVEQAAATILIEEAPPPAPVEPPPPPAPDDRVVAEPGNEPPDADRDKY
jgi:hypothetical protein